MGAHRPGDVLDLLLAHVLEREGELVAHLIAHHAADADPTRRRQGFEPSGDVDAIAKDVGRIDDDVAKIDDISERPYLSYLTYLFRKFAPSTDPILIPASLCIGDIGGSG
jgi:hypothetical protein